MREFHAHRLVCAALPFYASFAWRRKQVIEIDPMLAAAGSSGGGIEGTEAIAAVHKAGQAPGPQPCRRVVDPSAPPMVFMPIAFISSVQSSGGE